MFERSGLRREKTNNDSRHRRSSHLFADPLERSCLQDLFLFAVDRSSHFCFIGSSLRSHKCPELSVRSARREKEN